MKQVKKIVCALLVLTMLVGSVVVMTVPTAAETVDVPTGVTAWDGTAATEPTGEGTEASPYLLATGADLAYFMTLLSTTEDTSAVCARLKADINLDGKQLPAMPDFAGVFDGAGFTIYNIYATLYKGLDDAGKTVNIDSQVGLFGTLSGTVKNLTFKGGTVYRPNSSATNGNGTVAGMLGNGALIDTVSVIGTSVLGYYAGGIAGKANPGEDDGEATLRNCYSSAIVAHSTAWNSAAGVAIGGLVGGAEIYPYNGTFPYRAMYHKLTFENCVSEATICANSAGASAAKAGGFIGELGRSIGIAGDERPAAIFKNCISRATFADKTSSTTAIVLTGSPMRIKGGTGGIIGCSNSGSPANPNTTNFGYVYLDGCTVDSNITAANNAGAICGANGIGMYVTNCTVKGTVDVNDTTAGNAGAINGAQSCLLWGQDKTGTSFLEIKNSLIDVTVTSAGPYAGMAIGSFSVDGSNTDGKPAYVKVEGSVILGSVTASTNVGGLIGGSTSAKAKAIGMYLNSTLMSVSVTATDAEGYAGALFGYRALVSDAIVNNTYEVDANSYINLNGKPVSSYETVDTTAWNTYDDAVLADGTMLGNLNTYATTNGYRKWVAAAAPEYVALYVPTLIVTNESALTHQYNGTATEVTYDVKVEGTTVDVAWYDMASGSPAVLAAAPSEIGTYRVVVTPSDVGGNEITDDIVTIDFTISKADVTIVPNAGTYAVSGSTYTVTYDGDAHTLTAVVKSGTTGMTLEGVEPTVSVTQNDAAATATEPGTYQVKFDYAGDSIYNAASLTVSLVIAKIQIAYPANEWNVPTAGYNGTEQSATLVLTADQAAALNVEYDGDYTATEVTPDGETLTATATVTLKATAEAHYELTGTVPTYTKDWAIVKGTVTLKLVNDEHIPVVTDGMMYDGVEKVYHIGVFNSNDTWIFNLTETMTVLNAGPYSGTYSYVGDEHYEAAINLEVTFTVATQSIEITLPKTSYDKTYDGEAYTDEDAEPTYDEQGKTWNAPVYKWEKKGEGDTYTTVTAAEVLNGGSYRLTVTVTDTTGNYAGKKEVTFTISRATATLEIDGTGYTKNETTYTVTYNGDAKVLTAITNSDGVPVVLYGGSATVPVDANTYAITVTLAQTDNYEAASITATLVIEKAVVTLPGAADLWTYTTPYVYNGENRTVNLNAAFLAAYGDLITVETGIGDAAPTQKNAGTWNSTFTVRLKSALNSKFSDETTADKTLTCTWVISPADADLSGIVFGNAEKQYTGAVQTLTATGIPTYIDVQYSAGTSNVCDGYAITATLTLLDTRNYNPLTNAQKTMTAYLTITPAQVTIQGATGNVTNVKYTDGSVQSLSATAEDGNGIDYTSSIRVTITKGGETVTAADVRDVGIYEFTFRLVNENAEATPLRLTLTITKGTYPTSNYRVTGETTVIADGKEHGLNINSPVGPDGEPIVIVETPAKYTEPGVYTLVFKLRGTDNYEAIPDVVCTLTILTAEVKDEDKGVTVEFGNGLDPTLVFTVADADKKGISTESVAEKTSLKALYSFALTDAEGTAVTTTTGITVRLNIPEKYLQDESLKIVKVTTKKDGSLEVKELTKKSDGFTMSEDGTYCTFTVTNMSVSYGIAAGSSNIPQFVAIGAGAAALIAATVITIVRVTGHAKKNREDEE